MEILHLYMEKKITGFINLVFQLHVDQLVVIKYQWVNFNIQLLEVYYLFSTQAPIMYLISHPLKQKDIIFLLDTVQENKKCKYYESSKEYSLFPNFVY